MTEKTPIGFDEEKSQRILRRDVELKELTGDPAAVKKTIDRHYRTDETLRNLSPEQAADIQAIESDGVTTALQVAVETRKKEKQELAATGGRARGKSLDFKKVEWRRRARELRKKHPDKNLHSVKHIAGLIRSDIKKELIRAANNNATDGIIKRLESLDRSIETIRKAIAKI